MDRRLACVLATAVAGCGGDPASLEWVITHESPDTAAMTASLRVQIAQGTCDGSGTVEYEAVLGPDGSGGEDPGELGKGTYAFSVEAISADCVVIASGCTEIDLPKSGEVEVPLAPMMGASICEGEEVCNGSGRCRSTTGVDAGPVPCETEGESCGDGAGVCRSGECCTGCWDGSACQGGRAVDACGVAGGECASCTTGNACAGGACTMEAGQPELSLNALHSVLRLADGRLYGAGSNMWNQLGPDAPVDMQFTEINTGALRFSDIASSQFTTCGITSDDASLYCWGTNTGGSLARNIPMMITQPDPTATLTDPGWAKITAGDQHLCGIRSDGSLYCWGVGALGQLGTGSTSAASLPAPVMPGSRFGEIASLKDHTCAIRDDGTLWCWGLNDNAQLATPSSGPSTCTIGMMMFPCATTPQQIGVETDWIDVAAGVAHTCGIRAGGTLWCWGRGEFGELGEIVGGQEDQESPQRVGTSGGFLDVATGDFHTCALGGPGGSRARCWGAATQGQTGTGTTATVWMPVPIGDQSYTSIAAGWHHTCAPSGDAVFCWGDNDSQQLGIASMADALSPTEAVLVPAP